MNRIAPIAPEIESAASSEDAAKTGGIAPIALDIDSAIFREDPDRMDQIALIAPDIEGAVLREDPAEADRIALIAPHIESAIQGGDRAPAGEIAPIAPGIDGAISLTPAAVGPDSAPVILVVGGLLVRGGEVLLGRRSSHRRICPDTWDMIGGHVESGETLEAALARELREEIGVTPTRAAPVAMIDFSAEARRPVRFHVFRIDGWTGEPAIRDDEHVALRWFDLDAACALPDLASAKYPAVFRAALADKAR